MANQVVRATIAAGTSLSAPLDLGDDSGRLGLLLDPSWTAAGLSFQVATAGEGLWQDLYDDAGAEAQIDAASAVPGRAISIATPQLREALAPWRYLRVRSGTGALPVVQTSDVTVIVVTEG